MALIYLIAIEVVVPRGLVSGMSVSTGWRRWRVRGIVIVAEVESPTAGERSEHWMSGHLAEVAQGYQRILEGNPHHPRAL